MMDRKELINQYKQEKVVGGIFRVTNTHNGMYLLGHATNIKAKQNSFNFMFSFGSCLDYRLKNDLTTLGGKAFTFETLEILEKKKEQTQDEFIEDLKLLEQIWSEKLDSSSRY
jgi:hypothetical protein